MCKSVDFHNFTCLLMENMVNMNRLSIAFLILCCLCSVDGDNIFFLWVSYI